MLLLQWLLSFGLLSLTQLEKITQSYQNQPQNLNFSSGANSWMLNPKRDPQEDDDSWEVRAFAEDTSNIMGATWPPRSYTCTFCRREFRSAQALGGHMNVHRRDRARLHQTQRGSISLPSSSSFTSSSTLIIPTQELSTNGGLCLLYQLPNPNGAFTPTNMTACAIDSPSTLLSISLYPSSSLIATPSINFPVMPHGLNSSQCYPSKDPSGSIKNSNNMKENSNNFNNLAIEEPDLELRLGHRPTPS